jgi:hypothetical protein
MRNLRVKLLAGAALAACIAASAANALGPVEGIPEVPGPKGDLVGPLGQTPGLEPNQNFDLHGTDLGGSTLGGSHYGDLGNSSRSSYGTTRTYDEGALETAAIDGARKALDQLPMVKAKVH